MLGVQPILGRDFVDADAQNGAPHVVVLSYSGWQIFFNGDPKVIGQTLRIGGEPSTVIGVLPAGVSMPRIAIAPVLLDSTEALVTLLFEPFFPSRWDLSNDLGNFNYRVIARLKSGVTPEQARDELEALQHGYTLSAHLPFHFGILLAPLAKDVTSGISTALWLMFAAIVGVLLIACVNPGQSATGAGGSGRTGRQPCAAHLVQADANW